MIAADTSSLVAYFSGTKGADVDKIADALTEGTLVLPPVVITELLTDPQAAPTIAETVIRLAALDITEGYWARAGTNRRIIHSHKLKARVGDALIAQSCIDHDVALITRDTDFRHFARYCGLKLA